MISWPIAFVLVFLIGTSAALISSWMDHKHEYRMERLEHDSQIVERIEEKDGYATKQLVEED